MLRVASVSFDVITLQIASDMPKYTALCLEFPRLAGLVALLDKRRRQPTAAFGQCYQIELIESGTFTVPSLSIDGDSHAVASLLLRDKCVFYAFDHDPDLILGASLLAEGFPLTTIVIPSKRAMINIGDPVWGMGAEHMRKLQTLGAEYAMDRPSSLRQDCVTVITGEANFAHHIWNQLSAFDALAANHEVCGSLEILATHQPLGSLAELFPEAPHWLITYCPDTHLEARNGAGRMFVPLGGFCISRHAQARVVKFAQSRLSAGAGAIVERVALTHRPTFWLSIRSRNRTASNQTELLVALIRAAFDVYPSACVILDGHSLPADFETNPSYDRPSTLAIVDADRAIAASVIDRLRADGIQSPRQEVIPLIGYGILDSIAIAGLADVYFCHHGTIQHKIGWLTNVPGFVHSNLRTLSLKPAQWVQEQVEDGAPLIYIDPSEIEDEPAVQGLSEVDDSLRIECYRFVDVGRTARSFMAFVEEMMGRLPVALEGSPPQAKMDVRMPNVEQLPESANEEFQQADQLTLQRQLLFLRTELSQRPRSGAARTALESDNAALTVRIDQKAESERQLEAIRRLQDELVRRDLELIELHRELQAHRLQVVQLRSELDIATFSAEQLLATVSLRAAMMQKVTPAVTPVPAKNARGIARRFLSIVLRLVRNVSAVR